jgi:Thiamine pyrophosphate enzyme, N-terminal TPP binding domain
MAPTCHQLWSSHSQHGPGNQIELLWHAQENAVMNVRDAFYEILRTHGITTIFGNPGSNELPLLQDLPDACPLAPGSEP